MTPQATIAKPTCRWCAPCLLAVASALTSCSQNELSHAARSEHVAPAEVTASPSTQLLPPLPTPSPIKAKPYGDADLWLRANAGEKPIAQSHRDLVLSFYRMHLKVAAVGIPTLAEIEHYRPYFTSRLNRALACGARERDQMMAEHPGDKPPHVDHDIFGIGDEGHTERFEISASAPVAGEVWVYDVRFHEIYHGQAYDSTNTVKVMIENGEWRIDDFGVQGSIVKEDHQTMLGMLAECCEHIQREQPG